MVLDGFEVGCPQNVSDCPSSNYSDADIDHGLNCYNYYFEHNGYLFIGLDSGADTDVEWKDLTDEEDWGPEGAGLDESHIDALELLPKSSPKIIFMHHPILTGRKDGSYPDGCIIGEHDRFVDYCKDNNVQIILSGHTHQDHIYVLRPNEVGGPYIGEQLNAANDSYPWFVQTVSASKKSESVRGDFKPVYRVIKVENNQAWTDQCRESKLRSKIVMANAPDIRIGNDIEDIAIYPEYGPVTLHVYDAQGRHTGYGSVVTDIPESYYTGYYDMSTPQVIMLYNIDGDYRFEVEGTGEGIYQLGVAFYIEGGEVTTFAAINIPTQAGAVHQYTVDWDNLSEEEGVTVRIDSNGDGIFEETINTGAIYTVEGVFSLYLSSGWNLISLPLQPLETAPSNVLDSIDGRYNSVWAYHPDTGWSMYTPGGPSDLQEMIPSKGYWIDMDEPGTLVIQGTIPVQTAISLRGNAWNLVGYSSLEFKNAEECMSGVANDINSVWEYGPHDAVEKNWSIYAPEGPSNLQIMKPGYGYWIKADQTCEWDVNSP